MRIIDNSLIFKKFAVTIFFFSITLIMAAPSIAADEKPGESLLAEGIAYYTDESYEEALESLQGALELNPDSTDAAYYLGLTHKEMLSYPEAKQYLEKAVSLDPSNRGAHGALAELLYALERYDEAEMALKKVEGQGENLAQIAFIRGQILMKRKDYKGAIKKFETSASVQSKYRNKATYFLALAYLKVGKRDEGRDALKRVAQNRDEPILAREAEAILKKIEDDSGKEEKPLSLSLSYSVDIDDNVLLKPSEEISGVTITGEEDITHKLSFKAGYKFSFDKSALKASYSYFQSIHNDQSALDIMGHGASLAYTTTISGGEYTLPISISYYLLDSDPYLQLATVTPTYGYNINNDNWLIFSFSMVSKDFLKTALSPEEDRNALNFKGGVNYLVFFKERRGNITVGYALDIEDTKESGNWSYIGNKGVFAFLYPLREKIDLHMTGQYYNQSYTRQHSFYGTKRKDNFFGMEPKITYSFDKAVVSLRYSYSRNQSNISVYDYNRNVFTAGIEYKY